MTDLLINLPLPPSINRVIGTRLGNKHRDVQCWIKQADAHLLRDPAAWRQTFARRLGGPFAVDIVWNRAQRDGDIDNRIKPLLDYVQRLELIRNDEDCEDLRVRWGCAPDGCRVRLWPL